MNDTRQTITTYLAVAHRAWTDDAFRRRLRDEPRAALADEGWVLPDDCEVEVTFGEPGADAAPSGEELAARWDEEIAAGRLRLWIPAHPPAPLETTELSDEELEPAVGGGVPICGCNLEQLGCLKG